MDSPAGRVAQGAGLIASSPRSRGGPRLLHPRCELAFVEVAQRFEVHAARLLAHPDRRHWRYRRERRAAPERELDVAGEAAAREAPAVADAIPRHAPLHGALEARQRLGRQGIDAFGDRALRLRQAADVGKDRLVADRGLRRACPASHGGRQRGEDVAVRGRSLRGVGCLRRHVV